MWFAGNRCRKLRLGKHAYTPAFSHVGSLITAWSAICAKLQGCRVDRKYLRRMLRYVGWPFSSLADLPPLETAQLRLKESYALLRDEKKHSIHRRCTWQEELAAAYEANDNQPAAMHLLRLRRIEQQRRDFQQI